MQMSKPFSQESLHKASAPCKWYFPCNPVVKGFVSGDWAVQQVVVGIAVTRGGVLASQPSATPLLKLLLTC